MDEALTVGLAKCFRRADSERKEPSQIDRLFMVLLDYPIQRFATWILENEDEAPLVRVSASGRAAHFASSSVASEYSCSSRRRACGDGWSAATATAKIGIELPRSFPR